MYKIKNDKGKRNVSEIFTILQIFYSKLIMQYKNYLEINIGLLIYGKRI